MKTKILAITACLLWGSAFVGAKIGFEYTTPLHLSGMRFMLAGLLLVPFLIYQKIDWRASLRQWRYMLLFGFLQTFLQYGLFFMGLNKVPAAISAMIIGGGPLFVALMAHFMVKNDRLTFCKIIAIVLGMSGIAFISITNGLYIHTDTVFYSGVFLLIISNITGALTNIIVARNRNRVSPVMLTAFANFTGGVMLYVVSFFTEEWYIQNYTLEFYLAWIWLAIIPAVGFSIWFSLLKDPMMKVSELNIWKFVVPVSGVLLSWLFISGESPNLYSVIGIIIITIALITLQSGGVPKR